MKKHLLYLFALIIFSHQSFGQKIITGKVTSGTDGSPIPGASIFETNTNNGTISNADGTYKLTVNGEGAVLQFKYVGFTTLDISVNNRTIINASLTTSANDLNEVVVTGALGIQRNANELGYSAQTISSKDLNENRQTNMVNAIQGKIAGVTISSGGGAPGQGASIQIRGVNSLDPNRSNEPLFVIDGIVIDNSTSTLGDQAELRGVSNRGADINPDDIESLTVLKSGAATALYGIRGANGVVVITTKSGKAGQMRVNFSSSAGVESVDKFPEIQDKFSQGYIGVYDSTSFWPSWGPTVAEAKKLDSSHPDKLYNHFKDAYHNGYQYRNTLSLSGGTDKITYNSSFSQFKENGTIPFTDYKNLSAKLSAQATISKKIKADVSLNFVNSGGRRYNADRFNESLSYWSPRWNVNDYIKPDGTMKTYGNNNPIYGAFSNRFVDDVNRLIGSAHFEYQPLSWLNLSYRAGVDTYNDARTRTAPGPKGVANEIVYEDNAAGFTYAYNTRSRIITSTFIATATTKLGEKFSANLRVGQDLSDARTKNVSVEGDTLSIFDNFNLNNAKRVSATSTLSEYRLMGVFADLTVDFNKFLYLNLTGRNDFTSTLSRPNNSFFYPSASLSYVFSDQFKLPSYFSYAKARFSYAQTGKDALPYATSNGFSFYTALPAGYTGFTKSALLGNPSLRPEFTDTYEGGIDLQFLKNRIGLSATYYYSLSKDQLLQANISSTTGYVRAAVNAGSMRNRGIELTLNTKPIASKDVSWDLSINFSANRNKVIALNEGLTEISIASQSGYAGSSVTSKIVPGHAYGDLFGSAYTRYYTNGQVGPTYAIDATAPIVIGANGFQTKTSGVLIANSSPRWIGGLNSNFRYKNISLNLLFDTRQGQYKYNQMDNFFAAFGIAKYTEDRVETKVFEGVLADGTPNTKAVFLGQGVGPDGVNYNAGYYRNTYRGVSENFIQDASWFRLRSAGLSYSLPSQVLQNVFIKSVRLTGTVNNAFIITKYKGFDPESSSFPSGSNVVGFGGFTYPANRTFLLTLNVGF